MDTTDFLFTSDNLIENISKVGPWSMYGLATIALMHYFPTEYDENSFCDVNREIELAESIGCTYWKDVVIKFQTEVGYDASDGFSTEYVNQY